LKVGNSLAETIFSVWCLIFISMVANFALKVLNFCLMYTTCKVHHWSLFFYIREFIHSEKGLDKRVEVGFDGCELNVEVGFDLV
jgi:hypothetical protein